MKNKKINISFTILFFLVIMLIIGCFNDSIENKKEFLEYSELKKIQTQTSNNEFEKIRFFFLINFNDFNCTICLKQFQNLSDLIAEDDGDLDKKVLCLVESDVRELTVLRRMIKRWKKANRLTYDVLVIKDFRERLSLKKSCILLKKFGKFEIFYLPLEKEKYEYIKNEIRIYGNIGL